MPFRQLSFRQEELLSTMALVQLPEFAALGGESLGLAMVLGMILRMIVKASTKIG